MVIIRRPACLTVALHYYESLRERLKFDTNFIYNIIFLLTMSVVFLIISGRGFV